MAATEQWVGPLQLQYPGMVCSLGCPACHSIDASLQITGQGFGRFFPTGRSAYPADILQNILQKGRVQRKNLGLLAKIFPQLGNLPSGEGSNVADGLGEEQIGLGRLQRRQVCVV